MKKFLVMLFVGCLTFNPMVLAVEDCSETSVVVPKWEDYVPEKYQNPRNFTRGKSIAELSVGIVLTDLLITAPIGVPMIVHSSTKLKNRGYYEKKIKFEEGLAEAEKITNPVERQLYYDKLIQDCRFKEKYVKQAAKKQAKENKTNKTD